MAYAARGLESASRLVAPAELGSSVRHEGPAAVNAAVALDAMTTTLILEAEARLPGLWEMTLEEVAAASQDRSDWIRVDPAEPESRKTNEDSAGGNR